VANSNAVRVQSKLDDFTKPLYKDVLQLSGCWLVT